MNEYTDATTEGYSAGIREAPTCSHSIQWLKDQRVAAEETLTGAKRAETIARLSAIIDYKEACS